MRPSLECEHRCSWIPAFAGMTLEWLANPVETANPPIEHGPWLAVAGAGFTATALVAAFD